MKKIYFALLLIAFSINVVFAQTKLSGKVVSSVDSSGIPFVAVVLCDKTDSSQYLYSTITDMEGSYVIPEVRNDTYLLLASCLGFDKYSVSLNVEGSDIVRNIVMSPSLTELSEIEVLGRTKEKAFNKTSYLITASDRQKSSNSIDLLKSVPKLYVDNLSKSVSLKTGGAVKILLNGLSATEHEILAINKNEIASVDFIDFPPARYSEYSAVINIITKEKTSGGTAGFDLTNSCNPVYADDMVYFSYNKGASKIAFQYSFDYDDDRKDFDNSNYKYSLRGVDYDRNEESSGKSRTNGHCINLTYSSQKINDYAFNLKLSPSYSFNELDYKSLLTLGRNNDIEMGFSDYYYKSELFNPVADLYFSKTIADKHELALNVVGTGYVSNSKRKNCDVVDVADTLLNDFTNADNDKYSLIGEVAYNVTLGKQRLGAGYKGSVANDRYNELASADVLSYTASINYNKLYAEFGGNWGRFDYMMNCEWTNTVFSEDISSNRYANNAFTPRFRIEYSLSDISSIKFTGKSSLEQPSLADLSNDRFYISNEVVRHGNPALKPYWMCSGDLEYEYIGDILEFYAECEYSHGKKSFVPVYKIQDNFIGIYNENSKYVDVLKANLIAEYAPWDQLLDLYVLVGVNNYKARLEDGMVINHTSFPVMGYVAFNVLNGWNFGYMFRVPTKSMGERYIMTATNTSNVWISYDAENFSIGLEWDWPFSNKKTHTETYSNDVLDYHSKSGSYAYGNMISLNFSYNFQFGRKYNDVEKKLKNQDNDSGVMIK